LDDIVQRLCSSALTASQLFRKEKLIASPSTFLDRFDNLVDSIVTDCHCEKLNCGDSDIHWSNLENEIKAGFTPSKCIDQRRSPTDS
jgi:hypothetical protein